jgi:signal transduction histidine kinase
MNLLANAFKFTLSGDIRIIIKLNGSNLILIKVCDTGIGIKEEDQSKLFKAFGRLDDEYSKKLNSQGVGLGLVISN